MANEIYKTLNQSVLAKLETTPGTDASPTPAANAVLVANPDFSPQLGTFETGEVTPSLDKRAPVPTTGSQQGSVRVLMRGTGAPATPPRYAPLLQSASFGVRQQLADMTGTAQGGTTNSLQLAADVTGTAQAGGASTITLAAGASAVNSFYNGRTLRITGGTGSGQARVVTGYVGATKVATVDTAWTTAPDSTSTYAVGGSAIDDLYIGMVVEITGGAGVGQKRVINDYVAASKTLNVTPNWSVTPDATSTYAVRACSLFFLQSLILPNASIYRYQPATDGSSARLTRILGAAANAKATISGGQGCFFDLDIKGSLVSESDPAVPSAPVYDANTYAPLQGAQIYLDQTQAKIDSFTFDPGCEVNLLGNPAQQYGLDTARITSRQAGGTIRLPRLLNSTLDIVNDWANVAEHEFSAIWGAAAGQRWAVLSQHMVPTGVKDTDVQSIQFQDINFRTNGSDTGFFYCLW